MEFRKKSIRFWALTACIFAGFCPMAVHSAPKRHASHEDHHAFLREVRNSFDDIHHEIRNHESEIRTFEEKLANQENMIDTLREQMAESHQASKELLRGNSASFEAKLVSLETANKGLLNDLKQFKAHANETAEVLAQYKQKLLEIEKILENQNQNMEHLQTAVKSLMDLIQVKNGLEPTAPITSTTSRTKPKTYRVKSGDSLSEIAKDLQVTTQALKELNGLPSDKIIIGQTLKIP